MSDSVIVDSPDQLAGNVKRLYNILTNHGFKVEIVSNVEVKVKDYAIDNQGNVSFNYVHFDDMADIQEAYNWLCY